MVFVSWPWASSDWNSTLMFIVELRLNRVELTCNDVSFFCRIYRIKAGLVKYLASEGDSSVFVLSRTGHFGYSSIHNSVNIIGRTFMLHLHGSCHIYVFQCVNKIFW